MNLPTINLTPALAQSLRQAASARIRVDDAALAATEYQLKIAADLDRRSDGTITEIATAARTQLERRPWAVLIRGLPVAQATETLVALSARLGTIEEPYRTSWSRFVKTIVPSQDRAIGGRFLNEYLHTDGTDWPQPNDFTCLFCVAPDASGGGLSRLIDVRSVIEAVEASPDAATILSVATAKLPWQLSEACGGGIRWDPILDLEQESIQWLHYTIRAAAETEPTSVPPDTLLGLESFEDLLETASGTMTFDLTAGDLLIIDNTRCLHARTAVDDSAGSKRTLLRTKVTKTPDTR